MTDNKLLYQLITKDGIRSEIRPLSEMHDELFTAQKVPAYAEISSELAPAVDGELRMRHYRLRRYHTVMLCEFEEE